MTALDVLKLCDARGVQLVIAGDELRARGPRGSVSAALRDGLTEHKTALIELLGEGVFPDPTMPETVRTPADTPNTVEAIRACLDAQRLKAA